MKKKWTYLAVAGMLLGTAPVFTGCVDNDEPAGIEQLRGAKAQLLQAKAAVEEAIAEIRKADAEYRQAEAQWMRAKAAWEEYAAEIERLEAERKAAEVEWQKADFEQKIQQIKDQMEIDAINHEKNMLTATQNLEIAKRAYELVMQQIEIAEAIGSEKVQVTLSELKAEVKFAYEQLYGGVYVTYANSLYGKLDAAQKELYNAQLNAAHGITNGDADSYIPLLQHQVNAAQATVDVYKEAQEAYENYLAEDVTTVNWRTEIKKWEDELDKVLQNWNNAIQTVNTAKATGTYLAAIQALYGIYQDGKTMGTLEILPEVEGVTHKFPRNWPEAFGGAWRGYQEAYIALDDLKKESVGDFTLAAPTEKMPDISTYEDFLDVAEAAINEDVTAAQNNFFDWTKLNITEDVTYNFWNTNKDEAYEYNPEEGKYSSKKINDLIKDIDYAAAILAKAVTQNPTNTTATNGAKVLQAWLDKYYSNATTGWKKQIETAYTTAFGDAEKALADAEKALVDADKKMTEEEAKIQDLELEVAKWKETYNAYNAVKTSLVSLVNKYLDADGMNDVDFKDSEQFEKDLKNAALQYETLVAQNEYNLAKLQVELEKAMDGKYDAVYYAQAQVDLATYNFNKGWEAYQEALDNLNTALAVIAADEEGGNAEQPGDGNEDPAGEEEQPAE